MPRTSGEESGWRRLLRRLPALARRAEDLIAMTVEAPGGRGPAIDRWRESLRPALPSIWVAHQARRDDWVQPLPSVDAVVADGLLMSHVAIRMSLKNRIIIAALREHRDFDVDSIVGFARSELLRLAAESDQTALRLEPIMSALPVDQRQSLVEQVEREEQIRRPLVHRELADALRKASGDSSLLESMVGQARADALDELNGAVSSELLRRTPIRDHEYEARKPARVRRLIGTDLKALQRSATGRPRPRRDRWISTRGRS